LRALALAILCLLPACVLTPMARPNVVVIMADDLGIGDLRCYNPLSKIPTPNLDAFAIEGSMWTDMHSPSAVCTPTRYGLLTGRYCWRTRLKRGVLGGYSPALIEPGRATLASMLAAKGYDTAGFGKWHLGLGPGGRTDYDKPLAPGPTTVGFQRYFGIPASLDMAPYVYIEDAEVQSRPTAKIAGSKHRRQNGGGFWRGGARAPGFRHIDVLPDVTARATAYIESRRHNPRPFFLYIPLPAPHTPWLPTEPYRGKSEAGHYGDFTHMVDAMIGRILDTLGRAGKHGNTLVIITSDNGSHWPVGDIERYGHRANHVYRGQKADIHEGGHRVPFLVRWPGRVESSETIDRTACLTDVMATVAHIVGARLGDDAAEDSFDLFADQARPPVVHHSLSGLFALRDGRYKLIEGRGSGGFTRPRTIPESKLKAGDPRGQLFDLTQDPSEERNLWNERPDVVARLQFVLEAIREQGRTPRR
jgi:arylsulfatase A